MKRAFIGNVVILGLFFTTGAFADTYWASPSGNASWANSRSDDPLEGVAACSLNTANDNVAAGDTVYLRGGTYNTHIFPGSSGTSDERITYEAYSSESPIIINTTTTYFTYYHGIALIGRSYITVRGVTVGPDTSNTMNRYLMISRGGDYNEIDSCNFLGNMNGEMTRVWKGNSSLGDEYSPVHTWIHDSTFANTMKLYESGGAVYERMGLQIGDSSYDRATNYTTIEDNTFYCNPHHNIETFGEKTVLRNNFIYNAPCVENTTGGTPAYPPDSNGKYAHRNIQIYDGGGRDSLHNLIEGNRFGPSGQPPENDGGDGFTLTAPGNIMRYNSIYDAQNNGILLKIGSSSYSDDNRIYNNTIYNSGRYEPPTAPQWQGCGIRFYSSERCPADNVIKNNLIYSSDSSDIRHSDKGGGSANLNTILNNWCIGSEGECTSNGDPLFVDGTLVDVDSSQSLTVPDLELRSSSPAIDGGTHLTQTNGSGSNSKTLVVDNAFYFQDGTWGSALAGHQPDWIAIGTVGNTVQISSIDYDTNTITLSSGKTWADNASIWLYKKSDGKIVLHGTAPDYGAFEHSSASPGLTAPQSLKIISDS